MKHTNHLVACLVMLGVAGLAYLFIPQVQSLGWGWFIILACPLMHIWMSFGEHGQTKKDDSHKH